MGLQTSLRHWLSSLLLVRRHKPIVVRNPTENLTCTTETAAKAVERRQARRRYGDPVQVLLRDANPEPLRGWVMDRSSGGLGISSPAPVAVGALLYVRVALVPEGVPWVAVEVKHCRPRANRWLIGCQLLEAPSKEVLLLFR
jgi:hypothetical protein